MPSSGCAGEVVARPKLLAPTRSSLGSCAVLLRGMVHSPAALVRALGILPWQNRCCSRTPITLSKSARARVLISERPGPKIYGEPDIPGVPPLYCICISFVGTRRQEFIYPLQSDLPTRCHGRCHGRGNGRGQGGGTSRWSAVGVGGPWRSRCRGGLPFFIGTRRQELRALRTPGILCGAQLQLIDHFQGCTPPLDGSWVSQCGQRSWQHRQ